MWLPLLCPPHRRDCWHLCRCCIASHAVHLLQIPTDSLDPAHIWPAPRDILSESRSGPHTFKGKRSRSAARNCSVPMTCRSLHYTVSVSSPCWSNPSQPPKGRCNERTGSVSLITVGAEWPGTLDIMRNCVISSASLRVTQLDIMLSACLSSSWHPFPLSPYESSAGRGVLLRGHPRPWPVAKPRTLRVPAHKVHGSCLLRHSAADKEDGLAVAGSLQIIFLVFRFRAGSLQLRQSAT